MKLIDSFLIIYVFIIVLGMVGFGIMHEEVHVEIYRHYGIESNIDYFNYFPHLVTIPEKDCPNDFCLLAHNINEAIGYHLTIFYFIFCVFGLIVIILLSIIVDILYGKNK